MTMFLCRKTRYRATTYTSFEVVDGVMSLLVVFANSINYTELSTKRGIYSPNLLSHWV